MMDDGEWISITDAAERLSSAGDSVDRSTLSRYLKQHSEALPLKRDGKSNLVEFGSLAAHRAENVRLRKTGPAPGSPTSSMPEPLGRRFAGSQMDGVARKAQADAEIRELDLADRRRQITLVSEVDKSARDAIALMQSAFERAVEGEAATASIKYGWDERVVRLVLKGFARKGTDAFHQEVLKYLDAIGRVDMAAEQGDSQAQPMAETPLQ